MNDDLDTYISLLQEIRDGIKKAEIAMTIPRADRAKLILESIIPKMDKLWELETSETFNVRRN